MRTHTHTRARSSISALLAHTCTCGCKDMHAMGRNDHHDLYMPSNALMPQCRCHRCSQCCCCYQNYWCSVSLCPQNWMQTAAAVGAQPVAREERSNRWSNHAPPPPSNKKYAHGSIHVAQQQNRARRMGCLALPSLENSPTSAHTLR